MKRGFVIIGVVVLLTPLWFPFVNGELWAQGKYGHGVVAARDEVFTDGYNSLSAAINAVSTNGGVVNLTAGTAFTIATNTTIPANVTLQALGGLITIAAGCTLSVNGPFIGLNDQVFAGTVIFSDSSVTAVQAEWWHDGSSEWAPAITQAAEAGKYVLLGARQYNVGERIGIPSNHLIEGCGEYTNVTWTGTTDSTAVFCNKTFLTCTNSDTCPVDSNITIRNMRITRGDMGNAQVVGAAVMLFKVKNARVENVHTIGGSGGGVSLWYCDNGVIEGCFAENPLISCFELIGCDYGRVSHCEGIAGKDSSGTGDGINCFANDGHSAIGCQIDWNILTGYGPSNFGATGINLGDAYDVSHAHQTIAPKVEHNTVRRFVTGFDFSGSVKATVAFNTADSCSSMGFNIVDTYTQSEEQHIAVADFLGNTACYNTGNGFRVLVDTVTVNQLYFRANRSFENGDDGFYISCSSDTLQNLLLDGNIAFNNVGAGIYLYCDSAGLILRTTITNNWAFDTQNPKSQLYGLVINRNLAGETGTVDSTTIAENHFDGNATAAMSLDATTNLTIMTLSSGSQVAIGATTAESGVVLDVNGGNLLFDNNKFLMGELADGTNAYIIGPGTDNKVYWGSGYWDSFVFYNSVSMYAGTFIKPTVTTGITAVTPGGQGDRALTSAVNVVATCANANDAVTLPGAAAGIEVTVINNGAQTLEIWPASGDNLGAGVNTATTLAAGSNVTFVAYDATNWEVK